MRHGINVMRMQLASIVPVAMIAVATKALKEMVTAVTISVQRLDRAAAMLVVVNLTRHSQM